MSTIGEFDPSSEGCGYRENVCDCITASGKTIAAAVYSITEALTKKTEEPCKDIEQCLDKIIEGLRRKFEGPLKSCQECQTMASQGMAGTIEYAIRCAHSACDECLDVCSGNDDGKCCKNCGEDKVNCKCKSGQCEGEERESEDRVIRWIAWCNPVTGQIQATRQGSAGPGSPWYQVGLTESEQTALQVAEANCTTVQVTPSPESPSFPEFSFAIPNSCNLLGYVNGTIGSDIANDAELANFISAQLEGLDGLGALGLGGLNLQNIGQVLVGLYNVNAKAPPFMLGLTLPSVTKLIGCPSPVFSNALQVIAGLGYFQKLTGADVSDFTLPYRYSANLACPQRFLDIQQTLAAYFSNAINHSQAATLFGMHGYCPQNVDWMIQSGRAKPLPLQLAMLRRRGLHTSGDFHTGMREIGYLEPAEAENLFRLTEQIPTMSDIIRLMRRDADDDAIAEKFGLDDLFTSKYGGRLRQWAEWQGIPDEVAKLEWRAHWTIPSPGQLFTFYHRLRKNPKYGGEEKFLQEIKDALVQQDIAPFWQDKFLDVSFHPIGRIDIRRAYNVGAVTDDELPELYGQLGYSDETAEKLAEFTRRLRRASLPNHRAIKLWTKSVHSRDTAIQQLLNDGIPQADIDRALSEAEAAFATSSFAAAYIRGLLPSESFVQTLIGQGVSEDGARKLASRLGFKITNHPALKQYIAGTIDVASAREQMLESGMNTAIVDRLILEADTAIDTSFAVSCQKGVKRRYLLGELDEGEARAALQRSGTTRDRAAKLVNNWQCEKSAVGRAIPAAKLCEWLARGVIDSPEFISRLTKIGYTYENASLMLQDCLTFVNEKRAREAEKQAKQQIDAQVKAARAIEQANAKILRREAQLKAGREKQAKARINRQAQLLSAAAKLADRCDCTLDDSIGMIQSQVSRLQTEYAMTLDETLKTILLCVESWDGGDLQSFPVEVAALAEAAQSVPQDNPQAVV